jgi:hypothetical protein
MPKPVAPLQLRVNAEDFKLVLEKATTIRATYGLPFWDSVNLSCFEQGSYVSHLLKEALFHNGKDVREKFLARDEMRQENIEALARNVGGENMCAISSVVEMMDDSILHIPMLDFHCPASKQNLDLVREATALLGLSNGIVVSSGKSFHFYGVDLVSTSSMVNILTRGLLLAPIIDRAWLAHQLIENAAALRISPRATFGYPNVVSLI